MFNVLSLIIGLVALVLAVIGAGLGLLSKGTAGRNLNLFVIVVGVFRLILGGGIL